MRKTAFKKKYSPLKRSSFKTKIFKKFEELTPRQQLDNLVSKCIRFGSADEHDLVHCFTCGASKHWTSMDCGHFQRRANTSTRYDPKNLAPQCYDCNRFHGGQYALFSEAIDTFYGAGAAAELEARSRITYPNYLYDQEIKKWSRIWQKLTRNRSDINY